MAKRLDYLSKPLPTAPAGTASNADHEEYNIEYEKHNDVACLMLSGMDTQLQKQFENYGPMDMINELKRMFEKPPMAELYDLIDSLHKCKHDASKPVSAHVLEMKGYLDQLDALGCGYVQDVQVGLINRSLNEELFGDFVRNFNMHCMGKSISDLHAMLIDFEKGLSKKAPTPAVMAIQGGRITKPNKPQHANKKGKGKADKGKQVVTYQQKPKKQNPPKKKDKTKKDLAACHHCNTPGHWKRNCPLLLEELRQNKNKKAGNVASTSGIFMIELFSFPRKHNAWVYDTGCGTHICNTLQGLRGAKKLAYGESYLYVGNGIRAAVEAIGTFDLFSPSGLILVLNNCHYAPSIIRSVISVSLLLDIGFDHTFTNNGISVSLNIIFYFNAILINGCV